LAFLYHCYNKGWAYNAKNLSKARYLYRTAAASRRRIRDDRWARNFSLGTKKQQRLAIGETWRFHDYSIAEAHGVNE